MDAQLCTALACDMQTVDASDGKTMDECDTTAGVSFIKEGDSTPVTAADFAIQGLISAALREHLGSGARPPPSVLLIDGGKGQLSAALTVLNELGLGDTVGLLAIAKREEVRLRACGAKGFGGGVSLEGSTVGPDALGLQSF